MDDKKKQAAYNADPKAYLKKLNEESNNQEGDKNVWYGEEKTEINQKTGWDEVEPEEEDDEDNYYI